MKKLCIVCMIVSLVFVIGVGLASAGRVELIDDFFDPIDFELAWQYWTPQPDNILFSAELVEETPDGSDFAAKFTSDHDFGFAWMKAVSIKEGAKELRLDVKVVKGTGQLAIHLTDLEGRDFQFHYQVAFADLEEGWQKVSFKFEESNLYSWDPNLTVADMKWPLGRMNWTLHRCSGLEVLIDNIEVVYN